MQRRVVDTLLMVVLCMSAVGCPSIVDEAQRKQTEDENRRLLSERADLVKQMDRNQYKSEKAYRKAYKQLLVRHERLANQHIDSARYQYLYGYLLVDKSKKVKQYTRCLNIEEKNFWCLVGRGQVYADWGVENFARKDFAQAKQLKPDSIEPTIGMATLAFRKRRNQEAIQLYQKVLQQQPQNKNALYSMALLYDREQQWDQAASSYQKVLKVDAKHFDSLQALARIYLRQKKYTQAAEVMERAIALRDNFRILIRLANIYETQLINPGKALELYERASKLPQVHFHTYYRLGILRGHRGELDSGIVALEQAVRLRNDSADAFYQLARLHMQKGDYQKAIPILWKSVRVDGKKMEVRQALAESMLKVREYSDALRQYQEILNQDPKNQTVRNAMNQLLNRLGLTNDTFTARSNRQVIRKGEKIIYRCYQNRLKEQPKLRGIVAISMIIASDGKVERVGISQSKTTLKDRVVQTCVKWTFRRAIFPFIKTRSRLRYSIKLHN